ncbi:hypothetical protein H5410_056585 [Solanum commersonii]|uniref:Uncharacterized protein n=1 Tax=Solanum commersonii TaxID=4109 RepID=A0A9J5WKN3_SOLCO|nr:hypothetical protein H5410_056585 [Solanum commersonii]
MGGNLHHQKIHGLHSTRKSAKQRVYPLRGSFDHENGLKSGSPKDLWTIAPENRQNERFTHSGLVLKNVHENFWKKLHRKSGSPKDPWTIAHENWQNEGFTRSGDCLTFKIVLDECPQKILPKLTSEIWITKDAWTIAHENR